MQFPCCEYGSETGADEESKVLPEKCGVSYGLCVCCNTVVLIIGQVDMTRAEWSKDIFYQLYGIFRGPMADDDLLKNIISPCL
jgi:hypothetical protein